MKIIKQKTKIDEQQLSSNQYDIDEVIAVKLKEKIVSHTSVKNIFNQAINIKKEDIVSQTFEFK